MATELPDLGRLTPIRVLGEGATGQVVQAEMPERSGVTAVKILKPEFARDEAAVDRYLEVAGALTRLRHPNLGSVLEARRLDVDRVVVVMEYLEGQHLGELLTEVGVLDPEPTVALARQICAGLAAAHSAGILHLDLKPENVFLAEADGGESQVKLLDFGTALLRGRLSADGGAPDHWPPEQAAGDSVDARADIYALGVLLYRCLSARLPFSPPSGTPAGAPPSRSMPRTVPRPEGQQPLPLALETLVIKCLAPEPGQRFRSPEELDHALKALYPARRTGAAVAARSAKKRIKAVRTCPQCQTEYPPHVEYCGKDGCRLPPLKIEAPASSADSIVGKAIGKYRVIRMIGEGGMGRVFLAEHVLLGRKMALKMLLPEFAGSKNAIRRFFHEARAVSQLAHENIIQITDFVEEIGGLNYYVMEYLDGFSLHSLIRTEKMIPAERAVRIAGQVCDALAAVHAVGIIHRDLKPENIFLLDKASRPDFVKLLDFGVAKLVDANGKSLKITKAGVVLGTPEYMAPEQAAAKPLDHRADIYAMGVILYLMMTGRVPFSAQSVGQLLVKQMTQKPQPPSERDELKFPIPPALDPVILRCLATDAGDRFKDMRVVRAALERAL